MKLISPAYPKAMFFVFSADHATGPGSNGCDTLQVDVRHRDGRNAASYSIDYFTKKGDYEPKVTRLDLGAHDDFSCCLITRPTHEFVGDLLNMGAHYINSVLGGASVPHVPAVLDEVEDVA